MGRHQVYFINMLQYELNKKNYLRITLLVGVILILIKFVLLQHIPMSGLIADDYDYVNKARFFSRGDFLMKSYPLVNIKTSPIYPLFLSPWTLVDGFTARHLVLFSINFMFSLLGFVFSSLAIAKMTDRRILLVPFVLSLFAIPFIFSFYFMTENLLFFLLAVIFWLMADFELTLRSKKHFSAFVVMLTFITTTRIPAFSILPAILLICLFYFRYTPWKQLTAKMLILAGMPLLFYFLIHKVLLPGSRNQMYFDAIKQIFHHDEGYSLLTNLGTIVSLFVNQLTYQITASGFWMFPLALFSIWLLIKRDHLQNPKWRNILIFTFVSVLFFTGFCIIHLLYKFNLDPEKRWFIYGRYNDPATYLWVLLGISLLFGFITDPIKEKNAWILIAIFILACLLWLISNHWHIKYVPVNQSGLSLFKPGKKIPFFIQIFLLTGVLATIFTVYRPQLWKWTLLTYFSLFQLATLISGMDYVISRSKMAMFPQEVNTYIEREVPTNATILCNKNISLESAPSSAKSMRHVYRVLFFAAHPRTVIIEPFTDAALHHADYIFSLKLPENSAAYREVWSKGPYTLYKVRQ